MSKQGDYLPRQDAALIDWGDNFAAEITAHGTVWEIPAAEVSGVTTALAAFKALHTQAAGPDRSRVIVAAKNEARDAFKAKVRAMVKFRFENPIITNAVRVRCGLHPRGTVRTPLGAPPTVPILEPLTPLGNARIKIRVHDENTPHRRAIPYGYNGCVLQYAWGREPITDREALTQSKLATHFPYTLELPPEASGSILSLTAYWQIRDLRGNPSAVEHLVVS